MSSFIIFIILLLVILGLIAAFAAAIYNRLVRAKNSFLNAFSQIDVQLKRRYDLIPNIVESTRSYLAHESQTLEAVIKARNHAAQARESASGDPSQALALRSLASADGALSGLLGRLMMVSENYPELKADSTVKNLMNELSTTENQVGYARRDFNNAAAFYNQTREVFPTIVLAGLFGFQPAELWALEDPLQAEPVRFDLTPKAKP
jgi:LemA protein